MVSLLSTIHIVICIFLILVVLLQQGKGADLSVFGGGGTQTVFGARGAATLLHKLTVAGFIAFIMTTIGIGLLKTAGSGSSVMSDVAQEEAVSEEAATEELPPLELGPEPEAEVGDGAESPSSSAVTEAEPPADQ